jgi:hypothetical protein
VVGGTRGEGGEAGGRTEAGQGGEGAQAQKGQSRSRCRADARPGHYAGCGAGCEFRARSTRRACTVARRRRSWNPAPPLPKVIQERMGSEGNAYMEARRNLPPGGSGGPATRRKRRLWTRGSLGDRTRQARQQRQARQGATATVERESAQQALDRVSASFAANQQRMAAQGPVAREELDRLALVRQWGDRWQYKTDINGRWYYANSEEGAVESATNTYRKLPADQRLTPAQLADQADAQRFAEWDARYGQQDLLTLKGMLDKAGGVRGVGADAEFTGNGGRRTGAAVANQGARDAGEFRLQMNIYLRERVRRAVDSGQPVPASVLADYPDLSPSFAAAPPTAPTPAAVAPTPAPPSPAPAPARRLHGHG